jgi:hypothetical protein
MARLRAECSILPVDDLGTEGFPSALDGGLGPVIAGDP